MFSVFLLSFATTVALVSCLWLVSLRLRDVSIIDLYWGCGFVVIAWVTFAQTGAKSVTAWLLLVMATVWGLRLTAYLTWRNVGKAEDRRYAAMREKHGQKFWWVSLLTVFLLQAVIMWVVSMPIQAGLATEPNVVMIGHSPTGGAIGDEDSGFFQGVSQRLSQRMETGMGMKPVRLSVLVASVGFLIWLLGLFFETVGDYQMARFKAQPDSKGKVMDRGLWRYTRHPNYFGDFCVWWGIYLVAATAGASWTIFSPLIMSFFLLKVSGVAMLERDITERRPDYADYIRRTSAFFPMAPLCDNRSNPHG